MGFHLDNEMKKLGLFFIFFSFIGFLQGFSDQSHKSVGVPKSAMLRSIIRQNTFDPKLSNRLVIRLNEKCSSSRDGILFVRYRYNFFADLLGFNRISADYDDKSYSLIESADRYFDKLFLSDRERSTIYEIIHTMATHSLTQLLFKKKSLEDMGQTIEQVHPLRFVYHILSSSDLKSDLYRVRRSYFKWNGFMGGFKRRMSEELLKNNIDKYLPEFCRDLGIKKDIIDQLVLKKDWEGLVKALMDR